MNARLEAVQTQALQLMLKFKLIERGWTFGWIRTKRTLGRCNGNRKCILVSQKHAMLHHPDDVKDTILHEIAHALVGVEHGHDETWRACATLIGALPFKVKAVADSHAKVAACVAWRMSQDSIRNALQ